MNCSTMFRLRGGPVRWAALAAAVALAGTGCSTGSHTTGASIPGFNQPETVGNKTYAVAAHPVTAYRASGTGDDITDYVGVSWNWQLKWSYHCARGAGSFEVVPTHELGFGYVATPGDDPVRATGSGGSGSKNYTKGTAVVLRVTTGCQWKVQVVNLWSGGPSHS